MRRSAHPAGMSAVEARKKVVDLRGFVPPDCVETVQFPRRTIRMNLINQHVSARTEPGVNNTVSRAAVRKEAAALHGLHRFPISGQGFGQAIHLGRGSSLFSARGPSDGSCGLKTADPERY